LQVPAAKRDRVIQALQHNPNIEFAEVNALATAGALTNDPYVTNGYEWHLNKIQAPDAWGITSGNVSTVIAICDTGVAPTQPDLLGKLLPGYNFYANNTDTSDDYGHGTAVAGTAAGQGNNGVGVAGIAWSASILPIKISDPTGYATYSNMAAALTYAVDHRARVINMSFSGSTSSTTLQSAADYVWSHNGMIFASAGNTGTSRNIPLPAKT
jgi:thermitase